MLQKVTYQNNITRNYVYDSADRVSTITNNFGNNQSESFDYGYDANSNRESEVRKENGITKRSVSYVYDKLDRLTDANYTWNQQLTPPPIGQQAQYVENSELNHYGYDPVGNRINETKINRATTYTLVNNNGTVTQSSQSSESTQIITAAYDDLNQLKQLNEQSGISRFEYDDNGNLTQISKNGSINKYEYDVRNQLTKAKDGFDNELASFDYDFERKRIAKSSVGVATNYVYAGNQVVNEYQGLTNTANYTIGGGEVVKSEFSNGENNFHFTDALGSVTALANSTNGSLTSRNEYNAFGEVSTIGNSSNSIGYTGQRLDNETGLMALGNGERYYSPTYARFIQQDSFAGVPNFPQSLNRFAYALNNPTKHTDPSGNVVPLIVGALAFGGAFLLGVAAASDEKTVRERNEEQIKQGVDPSTLPNPTITALANNMPVIGSGFKAITGQDPITGEDLSTTWRIANGAFAVLDVLPYTKTGSKLIDKLGQPIQKLVGWFGRNKRIAEETAETAPKAVKLFEESADDLIKKTNKIENLNPTNKSAEILEQLKNNDALPDAKRYADEISDDITKGLKQGDELNPYPVLGMDENEIDEPIKLLTSGGEISKTRNQVQRLRGTNQERGNAFRDHLAELHNADDIEIFEPTKLGKRYHDVGTQQGLLNLRIEAKNYLNYYIKNGVLIKNQVKLTSKLHLQIYKDVLWMRAGRILGEQRLVQWEFTGAPPSEELKKILEFWKIPYVY